MRRRECRIKCRGTVRAEGRCQEVVVTQSKASEVVDQESTVVGRLTGWTLSRTERHGPRIRLFVYPRLACLYIYLSAYCFYFRNVRRRIFIAFKITILFIGLKCGVCGERWVLWIFKTNLCSLFKVIRSYDWVDFTWFKLDFWQLSRTKQMIKLNDF